MRISVFMFFSGVRYTQTHIQITKKTKKQRMKHRISQPYSQTQHPNLTAKPYSQTQHPGWDAGFGCKVWL
jgi:hypothetical protein